MRATRRARERVRRQSCDQSPLISEVLQNRLHGFDAFVLGPCDIRRRAPLDSAQPSSNACLLLAERMLNELHELIANGRPEQHGVRQLLRQLTMSHRDVSVVGKPAHAKGLLLRFDRADDALVDLNHAS